MTPSVRGSKVVEQGSKKPSTFQRLGVVKSQASRGAAGATPALSTFYLNNRRAAQEGDLFVTWHPPRKKCSVCQERWSFWQFTQGAMSWRECVQCMPERHRSLIQEVIRRVMNK